ncbi:hypothetical protein M430DRAFT_36317 [Amorphotheca resinae ATCC 22711]|jgi:hypothetical protein|uniref:GRAM domain-containing protein n=1 Tax=Amorphotheca resinae ATCC 22711 TaxID=857342 RepID=A0A2T3AX04_AMORE|nr:hypothetical protein M430DRAFT_36317 [Amorphotheca resinae ATCC 22711]PSS13205.1 hypothetical protein M430DRAFT_36317 [Amorphotheca resinae ATCC 22711]
MYQFHQELHSFSLQCQERRLKAAKSWVMTSPGDGGFIKLPNERILYTSPPRTSLQISTPNTFPGTQPFSANSDAGVVSITNQRLVYLPTNPTPELQSFSCPILNTQDAYVRAPFFGANYWTALCKPVAGGGIPTAHAAVELRLTFREGGAFDFHNIFEQVKERLYHAYTLARETGQSGTSVDLANVHLEQLPAYEPAQEVGRQDSEPVILSPRPVRPTEIDSGAPGVRGLDESSHSAMSVPGPDEPPPGYEEAQAQAVSIDLDQRLRNGAHTQAQ